MRRILAEWTGVVALVAAACVPNGPPTTSTVDAGPGIGPASRPKPQAKAPTAAPFSSSSATKPALPPSIPLGAGFEDTFEREGLGTNWRSTSQAWRVEKGRLCVKGARNHPVWLSRTLPTNVRIEFDAVSDSSDGDIKAEIFGDGLSAATATSYTNATSYLAIFGGWKNAYHVLARIDEHAKDRPEIRIDPDATDPRLRPVNPGQVYHFRVERSDERTLSWWVGDVLMFKFADPAPLSGAGHDHFGFNEWEAPLCFDNVKVVPL